MVCVDSRNVTEITGEAASMQHVTRNLTTELDAAACLEKLKPDLVAANVENSGPWTGKDVLQFLCFEMGKDKQGRISRGKTIDPFSRLLSIAEPCNKEQESAVPIQPSAPPSPASVRRQRKGCKPSRLPPPNADDKKIDSPDPGLPHSLSVCPNSACKSKLSPSFPFCTRCSCCICKQFDENKDPSLWISCTSHRLDEKAGCGLCCHVECALKGQITGVVSKDSCITLDGNYYCQSCGGISTLIGCLKEQLSIAKDACKLDALCHRLFLSHRLLNGTLLYKNVYVLVDQALKILESEVGPIVNSSAKLEHGSANRLTCIAEVQKLIYLALEKVEASLLNNQSRAKETKLPEEYKTAACTIRFENVTSSSVVVAAEDVTRSSQAGYKVWHRKASEPSYANAPTCVLSSASQKAFISNLQSDTEYAFKVVPFSSKGDDWHREAKCCTKNLEVMRRPMKSNSSHMVLSNINTTPEGNSRCIVEGTKMKHTSDECIAGCKLWESGKVMVGQEQHPLNGNGLSQSVALPGIIEKGKEYLQRVVEHPNSLTKTNYHIITDASPKHVGGLNYRQVSSSSTSGVLENRNLHSRESPPAVQMGSPDADAGKVRGRKGPCMCVQSHAGEPMGLTCPCRSEADKEKKRVTIFNTGACLHDNGLSELNPLMGKPSATDVMGSDHPFQSWAVQVRAKGRGLGMKSRTGMVRKRAVQGLERVHDHMNGGIRTSGRVDCGANNFEFSVKVIRWLECEGHLNEDFRMKFLTWYSLKATDHEKKVVSVFIDTLQDDPASLADQLMDAFEDIVATKRHQLTAGGYGNGIWQ